MTVSDRTGADPQRQAIEDLIANPSQQTYRFEPIVDLASDSVVAYRSRSAGRAGTGMHTTSLLIDSAVQAGLLARLDWSIRTFLMGLAMDHGLQERLHFTPEPATYGHPCPTDLSLPFVRARQELDLAAEIPIAAFEDEWLLRSGVSQFQSYGWLIVIDDIADLPDGLKLAGEIQPSWVRLDMDLAGRTPPVSDNVARMLDWAHNNEVAVLAHGVTSEQRRAAARDLGAAFARGPLIGLAGDLPEV